MTLEADYLIIGSGAVGMAFADTLLSETTEETIIIVDRYAKAGGHWNVAYPFVTLHQPSQFYGVSSKELSKGRKDEIGLNKGLFDLATGAEVSAYFDEVMRHTFLPTGRVQYFPLCDYKGDFKFESLITGEQYMVKVKKKLVDATYFKTNVPATHTPNFSIAEGVDFIPINDLPNMKRIPDNFVIVGGGKTGIDACLWLLEQNVNPDKITWIVSRDAWLLDRQNTQPTSEFFEYSLGTVANQTEAIAGANSVDDLFDRLEAAGVLVRLDRNVRPKMFHGATISQLELEQLRRIKNVVRLGRVKSIEQNEIILDKGTIPASTDNLYVDCSASAISNLETKTIFEEGLITPQTVRPYQPVFSASVIAYVEANYPDDKSKNKLCQVVPLPNHDTDWLTMVAAQMVNQFTWSQDKVLRRWLRSNRLDGFGDLVKNVDRSDEKKMAILQKLRDNSMPAMMKLQQLIAELESDKKVEMKQPQLQVKKDAFFKTRLMELPAIALELEEGEILVQIKQFSYTANNITYAITGDRIGYWQFFPALGEDAEGWGVIPVWGFAEIVESKADELPVGERLYGYFPPAKYLKIRAVGIKQTRFVDGSAHRAQLPAGYNFYTRVEHEKDYDSAFDKERMLFSPLHLTSYFIWDAIKEQNWYDAKQIIILSASSKTSTGLGYALQADESSPKVIGMTSSSNLATVENMKLYDQCLTYDDIAQIDSSVPTLIIDMSGNAKVLVALHQHLGEQMKFTINVGLTHWMNASAKPPKGLLKERSQFFFAPTQIQKRMKEWGMEEYHLKTSTFLRSTAAKTKEWMTFRTINGLEELARIHPAVCEGKIPANEGLIVELG